MSILLIILLYLAFWSLLVVTSISSAFSFLERNSGCGDSMMGIGPLIVSVLMCIPLWIIAIFVPVNAISTFIVLVWFICHTEHESYKYYKQEMANKKFGSIDSWPAEYEDCYDFRPISYAKWMLMRIVKGYLYYDDTRKLCKDQVDKRHLKMMNSQKFFKKVLVEDLAHYSKVNIKLISPFSCIDIAVDKDAIDSVLDRIFKKCIKSLNEIHHVLERKCIVDYEVTVS